MRPIDATTLKAEFTGNFKNEYTTAEIHALIDLAPTVNSWISVKDRMPDENEEVIICYEWTGLSGNKYREVTVDTIVNLDPEYFVIAWMPLPSMPKEESDD